VDEGRAPHDHPGLVALEAADEVPGERGAGRIADQRVDLGRHLLGVVLADLMHPGATGGGHRLGRLQLRHRHQLDRPRIAPGGLGCAGDALAHRRDPVRHGPVERGLVGHAGAPRP
jgi:hypothetical protein